MTAILGRGGIRAADAARAASAFGTPLYIYDERTIRGKCREVMGMPNAFGIEPRFAMKANSSKAILQLVRQEGFGIDASSMNEARRARASGFPLSRIMLTTQEVPLGRDRMDLEVMTREGLKYNVCSLTQLRLAADFAVRMGIPLSMRVHPGMGSGESSTRNTGDKYSCFGVHLTDLDAALRLAREKGVVFDCVHVHIGSGGDPEKWRENVDRELGILERSFPDAVRVSFGGGLREARMPDETPANARALGAYAKDRIEDFHRRTGRKLVMEVEPGTYVAANAGYLITTVIDIKRTGPDGFEFLVCDGGMETNARPILYGSRHPFFVLSRAGDLLSSEFDLGKLDPQKDLRVVVGRCCESGDSQSLDSEGHIVPRVMACPEVGDLLVIGGCGAYCSSMTPFNYNSHVQAPEALLRENGRLDLIRAREKLSMITANEKTLRKWGKARPRIPPPAGIG
jgi:diaminopimelate decarboxylase